MQWCLFEAAKVERFILKCFQFSMRFLNLCSKIFSILKSIETISWHTMQSTDAWVNAGPKAPVIVYLFNGKCLRENDIESNWKRKATDHFDCVFLFCDGNDKQCPEKHPLVVCILIDIDYGVTAYMRKANKLHSEANRHTHTHTAHAFAFAFDWKKLVFCSRRGRQNDFFQCHYAWFFCRHCWTRCEWWCVFISIIISSIE